MSTIYTNLWGAYLRMRAALARDRRFALSKQLSREQWFPPEQIEALQAERLRSLLAHAATESAYYSKRLAGLARLEQMTVAPTDLSRMPLLRRDDIQKHGEEILCRNATNVYPDSSGGSTGHPVNLYHDDEYRLFFEACELLFLSWMDVAPGDRTAVFWGADRDLEDESLKEQIMQRLKRVKILNSFKMTQESLDRFLSDMQEFRPVYVIGYASSLYFAAQHMNESGRYQIRPRAVRSAAEMLYDHQRQEIERAFNSRVFNFYGSREVSHLAAECREHAGLHVFASGRIVEIVDDSGRPMPAGETGYLAVTDLTNRSFPLIRYLNGDMGSLASHRCPCGRGYPLLTGVAGRASDIIVINGMYIHGEFFTHLFYGHPEVRQFQVIQETTDSLTVKVVAAEGTFDSEHVVHAIRDKVGAMIAVNFLFVDEIPPLTSGKYRFTINNVATSSKVR
jgi:phenylacetate-CoA ligase